MSFVIVLSFIGEGTTDDRFFPNITERLIEQVLFEKNIQATIQWQIIKKRGTSAEEKILNAAQDAKHCTMLIVHSDADDNDNKNAYETKIKPGIDAVAETDDEICKNITFVIPISETEAWLLVDKELLKEEMNTLLSNNDLGLDYKLNRIESIADPKALLESAIRTHHNNLPRKRRRSAVTISELYSTISQRIELDKLEILGAYVIFKQNIINALQNKNILT